MESLLLVTNSHHSSLRSGVKTQSMATRLQGWLTVFGGSLKASDAVTTRHLCLCQELPQHLEHNCPPQEQGFSRVTRLTSWTPHCSVREWESSILCTLRRVAATLASTHRIGAVFWTTYLGGRNKMSLLERQKIILQQESQTSKTEWFLKPTQDHALSRCRRNLWWW